VIGYEQSEQLDVEPVKYFVLVTRREKRACKRCEERGVMAAPLPPRIIEKSLVSDQVIVDAIISKYSNHCPLYRQSVILLRDAGINISRATIDGWVMRVGDLLTPLVAVMGRELVGGTYIQADETPVDVQTRDGRSRNHPGCHAALNSRIEGLYFSILSVFLLHSHCTEIADVCIQITDEVVEKVCPRFECKKDTNGKLRARPPGA
jgi:transposase